MTVTFKTGYLHLRVAPRRTVASSSNVYFIVSAALACSILSAAGDGQELLRNKSSSATFIGLLKTIFEITPQDFGYIYTFLVAIWAIISSDY